MLKPAISNSSAMQGPAQINAAADFAEQGWRFRSGTAAARAALPSGELFEGLTWQDTDGGKSRYIYQSAAWVFDSQSRTTTAGLNYNSSWGNASSMQIAKADGIVTTQFSVSKVGAIEDGDVPGSFPAGFRPAVELRGAGQFAGSGTPVVGFYAITTGGTVTLSGSPGSHTLFFATIAFETP